MRKIDGVSKEEKDAKKVEKIQYEIYVKIL